MTNTLKIILHRATSAFLVFIVGFVTQSHAAGLKSLEGKFEEGGYAIGSLASPDCKLTLDGSEVSVGDDGRFVIGFNRDEKPELELRANCPGNDADVRTLTLKKRDYHIQRIDGLPEDKVTPPADVIERIHKEAAEVREIRKTDSRLKGFEQDFIWPAHGPITGVFGSQRILNGKPRQPHYGVDIAAPEGSPVVAPADGVVLMANPDMYFSGATLILDHGHGLMSAFLHMKSITVKKGDFIRKGDPIGTVGMSGRATGVHLDWRINWFEKRLDAALFVQPMSENASRQQASQ